MMFTLLIPHTHLTDLKLRGCLLQTVCTQTNIWKDTTTRHIHTNTVFGTLEEQASIDVEVVDGSEAAQSTEATRPDAGRQLELNSALFYICFWSALHQAFPRDSETTADPKPGPKD
eukprot:2936815-Amphidinium_carterae.1